MILMILWKTTIRCFTIWWKYWWWAVWTLSINWHTKKCQNYDLSCGYKVSIISLSKSLNKCPKTHFSWFLFHSQKRSTTEFWQSLWHAFAFIHNLFAWKKKHCKLMEHDKINMRFVLPLQIIWGKNVYQLWCYRRM